MYSRILYHKVKEIDIFKKIEPSLQVKGYKQLDPLAKQNPRVQ